MIAVDASVIATALGDDGSAGRAARARLAGERLVAPELVDLEVAAVFRRLAATGVLTNDRAGAAIADLRALPIERVPHRELIGRCWELRHTMTVYDASYVAVAESFGATLLTGDQRLASAPGPRCEMEILPG